MLAPFLGLPPRKVLLRVGSPVLSSLGADSSPSIESRITRSFLLFLRCLISFSFLYASYSPSPLVLDITFSVIPRPLASAFFNWFFIPPPHRQEPVHCSCFDFIVILPFLPLIFCSFPSFRTEACLIETVKHLHSAFPASFDIPGTSFHVPSDLFSRPPLIPARCAPPVVFFPPPLSLLAAISKRRPTRTSQPTPQDLDPAT